MAEKFDVVILGMGPGGEVVASRLLAAGKKIALVERELLGGECAYWACIPSKTLLRPPEVKSEATRAFGTGTPELYLENIFDYRDYMIRNLDDSGEVKRYEEKVACCNSRPSPGLPRSPGEDRPVTYVQKGS